MKINSKGFTMVELLAAIIIMGILMGIGLPILTNTINKSRKKEYVSASLKMVSRAEYMMRANSNVIEKPNINNAIVMNLSYLDDGSFSTAPYGGKYDFESSFVVVKNIDDKLKYYVMLVENVPKGGYYGIDLTLSEDVQAEGINKVDSIQSDDLYKVNVSSDLTDLLNYINDREILDDAEMENVENTYYRS